MRVAVWSTGGIGTIAVRAVLERPELKLAGVWVHSPEKAGKDVGALVGLDPIGLVAGQDVDAILASGVDCVVYAASGPERDGGAIPDFVRLLAAGVNVVAVTAPGLLHPPAYPNTDATARMTEAALAGGATFYASGIEPGFAADQLPLVLATQSRSIRSIHSTEMFLYDEYPVAFVMRDAMGFGMPMDYEPLIIFPGAMAGEWGPSIRLIAAGLGVEVTEILERYDRAPAERRIETASGVIEPGTCGAVRAVVTGIVDGREAITIEHVNRMAREVAPEWPIGDEDGVYRIEIDGDPQIRVDMVLGGGATSANDAGMTATAMRVVNAIPAVVAAPPGLVSSLDLPLTLPVNPFR